jgi:hypothetical protein
LHPRGLVAQSEGMLIPQFSIRWLLGVTALAAVVFSIVAAGLRGHLWAVGVSVGIFAAIAALVVYALLFAAVWAVSLLPIASRERGVPRGSPFAAAGEGPGDEGRV